MTTGVVPPRVRSFEIALIPRRRGVLFPNTSGPILVGRHTSLRAVDDANLRGAAVAVVTQRDPVLTEITLDDIFPVATEATINRAIKMPDGTTQVWAQGQRRLRIEEIVAEEPFYRVRVSPIREPVRTSVSTEALKRAVLALFEKCVRLSAAIPDDAYIMALNIDRAGWLADFIASTMEVEDADAELILSTVDPTERLRRVNIILARELDVLELQSRIHSQVQEEVDRAQREYFLREQLKAIQKELGEADPVQREVMELRGKLAAAAMPAAATTRAEEELRRLEGMPAASPETSVIRTYLDWLVNLPWSIRTDDHLDLVSAAATLDANHFGLPHVKERILEFMAVRKLRTGAGSRESGAGGGDGGPSDGAELPVMHNEMTTIGVTLNGCSVSDGPEARVINVSSEVDGGTTASDAGMTFTENHAPTRLPAPDSRPPAPGRSPILCLIGPPGVGKTSLGRSIAEALGRRFVRLSLGGVRDEAEIRGHRRTYVGALPGRILHTMRQAGAANPVILLDEIDKIGADFRGDPSAALLETLDPEQNSAFSDHYLDLPYDLSGCLFIATANQLDPILPALRDRLEMIEISGYTEDEKLHIAGQFLVPRQVAEHGLDGNRLTFAEEALRRLIREYTREAGVRGLERAIGAICRKVARRVAEGDANAVHVGEADLAGFLGARVYEWGMAEECDEIGVATGVTWTEMGGDVLAVEVTLLPGKGALLLTGQLGDVMRESAQAALSYARSRAALLGIAAETFEKHDVHIHVPAGAIPKEGPSAGITIATALVSALTGRPVGRDVAMTGEITLRGRVLPVGGLKEKILAAHRAGITTFVLPEKNRKDIDDVPAPVRRDLHFVFADDMARVLDVALRPAEPPLSDGSSLTALASLAR